MKNLQLVLTSGDDSARIHVGDGEPILALFSERGRRGHFLKTAYVVRIGRGGGLSLEPMHAPHVTVRRVLSSDKKRASG